MSDNSDVFSGDDLVEPQGGSSPVPGPAGPQGPQGPAGPAGPAGASIGSGYDAVVLADSPRLYLPLNDAALTTAPVDLTGNHTAIATGTTFGRVDTNGVGYAACAYVSQIDTNYTQPQSNSMTYELWMTPSSYGSYLANSQCGSNGGIDGAQIWANSGGEIRGAMGCPNLSAGGAQSLVVSNVRTLNRLRYVVLLVDGNDTVVYIDGQVANAEPNQSHVVPAATHTLGIGYNIATGGDNVVANIARVAVYESALTHAQIMKHFLAGM